jgi:uncharacterized protein DUF1153
VEQSSYVRGHDGRPLTIADIPSPDTGRWVIRRKAEVIAAVNGGLLSLEEACTRYALDTEEFKSWETSYRQHGLAGLRITRLRTYSTNTVAPKRTKRHDQLLSAVRSSETSRMLLLARVIRRHSRRKGASLTVER